MKFVALPQLFIVSSVFCLVSAQDDGFTIFLENAMQKFPEWLRLNQYDPSSPIPQLVNLSDASGFLNVTGFISGQVWSGFSKHRVQFIIGDLRQRYFSLGYRMPRLEAIGEYSVEGTLMDKFPLFGSGISNLTHPDEDENSRSTGEIFVQNFGITADGYIDLSVASIRGFQHLDQFLAEFENLSADGYETTAMLLLKDRYSNDQHHFLPFNNFTLQYFEEVFAATPVSEMTGHNLNR